MRRRMDHEAFTVQDCQSGISVDLFLHMSLIPAALIVAVLSFLQTRAHTLSIDRRLPFLGGRFGIVVPLDTLGSISNRWSYGFAFGAVSSSVLVLLSEQYVPFYVPPWAKAIVYLVGALEVGLVYFPFFACLSTPNRTAGAVLGILYSLSWIIVTVWDTFTCPDGVVGVGAELQRRRRVHRAAAQSDSPPLSVTSKLLGRHQKLIVQWPTIVSLIFLLGRFIYILVKGIRIHLQLEPEDNEDLNERHQVQHVQRLLRKTPMHSKPLTWFQRRIYEWDPYFKFPNRIIGTSIVSLFGLYTFTLSDYALSNFVFSEIENLKDWLEHHLTFCNQTVNGTHMISSLDKFIMVAHKSWLATTIFASLNSVAYIFHVLACYRKHVKRLWRGQRGFLPEKFHKPSSAVSVASITRYSGWQIAFTLWGYLIVHFIHFLFAMSVAYLFILPIQNGEAVRMLSNLGIMVLNIGLVIGLVILQLALVQIFFLQDKINGATDKEKPLALNNKKAFHCFNYFFFFYNVVLGFSTCVLRLLMSVIVGSWLVSRIDRTVMQRGYEGMDAGYSTWIGMIFADHYHNNPVMVCFCQLLVSSKMEQYSASVSSMFNNAPPGSHLNSKARRRWMLAYTLLRNPHLIPLRKQHLSSSSSPLPQADVMLQTWVMASQMQKTHLEESKSLPEIKVTPTEDC